MYINKAVAKFIFPESSERKFVAAATYGWLFVFPMHMSMHLST